MAEPVLASSLSGLIKLAENPPLHLDNRIRRQAQHPSLVLYIARVPGSRDVFLTNMKPRDKVVSAQDVESSLYYCHLETAEDEALRAELDITEDTERPSEYPPAEADKPTLNEASHQPDPSPIAATPLPQTDQPSLPQRTHNHQPVHRKPIGSGASLPALPPRPAAPPTAESVPVLPSRPLGPRPLESPPPQPPRPNRPDSKENTSPHLYDESNKPPLPARQNSSQDIWTVEDRPPLPPRQSTSTISHHSTSRTPTAKLDFAVTLIRRDPGTGIQWNVGRVVRNSATSSNTQIVLDGRGYTKFNPSSSVFQRTFHLRPSKGTNDYNSDQQSAIPFSFLSPWQGPCIFSTGVAGRSLKCRHAYPPPQSPSNISSFGPRLAFLDSTPISELRLNLPVLGRKKKRPPSLGSTRDSLLSVGSARTGKRFGHRLSRSVDTSFEDEEDEDEWDEAEDRTDFGQGFERMDLSLGREKAGGGFAGRKAKLGKIIVESEGMLMLDLVVAANVAVWWAVSEDREP